MKNGFRLIQIWEDDWNEHKEIIKETLQKILTSSETFNFSENEIILSNEWYNCIEIPNYQKIEEISPNLMQKLKYTVENSGFTKYLRNT